MLGTASAALIGLLFVATSLHLAEIANEEIYRLRAQYTTLILLSTLVQGTVIMMPQPMKILGFELLAINLWGLSFPVTLLSKAVKIPGARGRGGFLVSCVGLHCRICNWHCGAGAVATGREWGMYGVTVSYTLLLFISIWNGWMIMQGIGRGEKFRK
jgi:modulator of FtsH protease